MRAWPPVLRAFLAQAAAFGLLALVVRAGLLPNRLHGAGLLVAVGILAAATGRGLRLSAGWLPFAFACPWAVVVLLRHPPPGWVWPVAFLGLMLVFGGGILTRVPLYHSNRAAWHALLALLPESPVRFADLGAGLAGPLVFLAAQRPDCTLHGIEASPLTFLLAWLRTWPVRRNCTVRWGSLWREDLGAYDVVYAFLSPDPMPELFAKATREMKPGSLFVSNTFTVPGQEPRTIIPLTGRKDACLLVWEL